MEQSSPLLCPDRTLCRGRRRQQDRRRAEKQVEIYIGRFNETLDEVDGWARITHNQKGDFYPDLWVEHNEDFAPAAPPPLSEAVTDLAARWPVNRESMVFVWENLDAPNQLPPGNLAGVLSCTMSLRDQARYDRFYALDLREGSAEANLEPGQLVAAFRGTGRFALEATVRSSNEAQGNSRIVMSANNFELLQEGNELIFAINTAGVGTYSPVPRIPLGPVSPGTPRHVIVSYEAGIFSAYLDGAPILHTDAISGGLENWSASPLILGDNWKGYLEGFALYTRTIGPEEAALKYAAYQTRLPERTPLETARDRCPPGTARKTCRSPMRLVLIEEHSLFIRMS